MALIDKETVRKEIERRLSNIVTGLDFTAEIELNGLLSFLDSLPEQPVIEHHEIEVEFRGEKVTVNREFCRKEDKNYSTSEQDDNVIWAALRAWCEKKGITAFELYPQQPEQPAEGLEEAAMAQYPKVWKEYPKDGIIRSEEYYDLNEDRRDAFIAGAEWQKAKMMEGAVETQILTTSFINLPKEYLHQNGIQAGDKVRVIVIKEE